jgi:methyltransferase (TIGR00027 family)
MQGHWLVSSTRAFCPELRLHIHRGRGGGRPCEPSRLPPRAGLTAPALTAPSPYPAAHSRRGPQPARPHPHRARRSAKESAFDLVTTLLFTDLVGSTDRVAAIGDGAWRTLLDRHDEAVRRQLARFSGHQEKLTGDGILATFDRPARAIRCGTAIRDAARQIGLDVRVGIHTGEVERRATELAGIAVHLAVNVAYRAATVTQPKVSSSAMNVALVRAHLTSLGVVDDPYARQMLPPNHRRVASALQLPGLRRLGHSSFPYLAARTMLFDEFVSDALDGGVRQVVVVGAGYDSRAWRLARPGVTFFEIDQPATQADKRTRAPDGGPVYVPADVTDPQLAEKLANAGFRPEEPTAFTVEGLVIYVAREAAADLLATLSGLGSAGSRLAVSFERGFERQPMTRRISAAYYRRAGETWRFRLRSDEASSFLSEAGWTLDRLHTPACLDHEHLSRTTLAGTLRTSSFAVDAKK